jgi:hypothetical protein
MVRLETRLIQFAFLAGYQLCDQNPDEHKSEAQLRGT